MSRLTRSSGPRLVLLQEQRYRRHFLREDGRQTAIVMAVVSVCYAMVVGNDIRMLGGSWLLGVSLASRALFLVGAVVAVVLLRLARWPRQQDRAFNLGLVATTIAVLGTHLTRIPSGQIQGPLIGGTILLGVLYFAQRGPIGPRAIVGCVIAIVSVTLILLGNTRGAIEPPAQLTSMIAIVALNVIGFLSARAFEEQRRKRFEAERRGRHARNELAVKLRELAAEKERAEAMAHARAAFLAAMSHEFRTPMNAVIGLSDLLLDASLEPTHRDHVRTISESARGLLALLNEILDFAKIDAQKLTLSPVPFDVRRLTGSVVEMLRPAATARGLELGLEVTPEVPEGVLGDDARLRQVLVNLVSNALKFTEHGEVWLRVSVGAGNAIAFRVEDTGIGMTPAVMERLFRPFEQADGGMARRHGGTGLGLAISKQIVLAMGGDIHVESEPERGSVFSFAIPLAAAEAPPATIWPPAAERRADRPSLALLVVDDHCVNREVARLKLGRLGHRVDLASDGPEALLAVTKKDYDAVFMDLQMPGMGGIEATVQIMEILSGRRVPPIIAMTASVFEADRDACRRAGMQDFVGKPIDLVHIDAVLSRVTGATVATLAAAPLARLRQVESLGEPRFVANLSKIFIADTRKRLPRMTEALGRGDVSEIEKEAHVLTSASATLGASEMSELCARIEGAAREGRLSDVDEWLAALSVRFAEVERALQQEIAGEPRPSLVESP